MVSKKFGKILKIKHDDEYLFIFDARQDGRGVFEGHLKPSLFITKTSKILYEPSLGHTRMFLLLTGLEVPCIERGDQEKVLKKPLFFLRLFFPKFVYV